MYWTGFAVSELTEDIVQNALKWFDEAITVEGSVKDNVYSVLELKVGVRPPLYTSFEHSPIMLDRTIQTQIPHGNDRKGSHTSFCSGLELTRDQTWKGISRSPVNC